MKKVIASLTLIGGFLILTPVTNVISANYNSYYSDSRYHESDQKEQRTNHRTHMQERDDNSMHNQHSSEMKRGRSHCH